MVSRLTYFPGIGAAALRTLLWLLALGILHSNKFLSPARAANDAVEVAAALQSKVVSLSSDVTRPADRDALAVFYANRGYRPVWVDSSGPVRATIKIMAEFAQAGDWGLTPADFRVSAARAVMTEGRWSAAETAAAEFEISGLILRYARHARGGRITDPDRTLSSYLDRRPVLPEPADVLARVTLAQSPDAVLRSYHPQNEQFQKLQVILTKLRAASVGREGVELPPTGPNLAPGQSHADVAILRRRLGIAATDNNDDRFDKALFEAVKTFQAGVSLKDDGVVGPVTRKALNSGGADHIKSIAANMELWRWMPDDLGSTHLFVNVPAFTIDFVQGGKSVLNERVITGKSATQTPIFSKRLTAIVLRPLWYLPDSIKLEKLLSAQRSGTPIEDEGYLVKRGGHAVDSASVDWNTANLKEYSIYQPSGDGNALGNVKFLFPNKHSVYLHDTPNKALFNASERLFSHGCIRLRNPLALAQRLLDADKGDGVWNVKNTVSKGDGNTQVMLDAPLPIHVAYFTVWVNDAGAPQFLGDPYGHEARVSLALDGKWDDIDKGADHLAAVDTKELQSVSVRIVIKPAAAAPRPVASNVRPRRERSFDPPSGLIHSGPAPKIFAKRRDKGGVGEMIRAALQH